MKYLIKQKMVSIGDDFSIKDENGREKFFVDGYGFSFGKKLSFQDDRKNELALIKKSLLTFHPHYKIYKNGALRATVSKRWLSFRPSFVIKDKNTNDQIEITGRLIDFEYTFHSRGTPVASVSKKWFRATDTYAVDMSSGRDPVVILAAAIIVDLVLHNK